MSAFFPPISILSEKLNEHKIFIVIRISILDVSFHILKNTSTKCSPPPAVITFHKVKILSKIFGHHADFLGSASISAMDLYGVHLSSTTAFI